MRLFFFAFSLCLDLSKKFSGNDEATIVME